MLAACQITEEKSIIAFVPGRLSGSTTKINAEKFLTASTEISIRILPTEKKSLTDVLNLFGGQ